MGGHRTILQFVKYGLVGVMNTLITLIVIFLCKSIIGVNPMASNAIGYVAGLINSFLWNKKWVFKSDNGYVKEAIKFAVGWGICYCVQFVIVYYLSYHTAFGLKEWSIGIMVISGYGVATLVGMVAYTIANFIYNRFITFRSSCL